MTTGLRNNADAKGSRGARESPQKYTVPVHGRQVDGVLSVGQSVFAQKDALYVFPAIARIFGRKLSLLFSGGIKEKKRVCIFFSVLILEY